MTKLELGNQIKSFFENIKFILGNTKASIKRDIKQFFEEMKKEQK